MNLNNRNNIYHHTILLIILLVGTNFLSIQAQISSGGYAETYLLRNIGARGISMAGS